MHKQPPLRRFDTAVQAYISSRRALGRGVRLDEAGFALSTEHFRRPGDAQLDLFS